MKVPIWGFQHRSSIIKELVEAPRSIFGRRGQSGGWGKFDSLARFTRSEASDELGYPWEGNPIEMLYSGLEGFI